MIGLGSGTAVVWLRLFSRNGRGAVPSGEAEGQAY